MKHFFEATDLAGDGPLYIRLKNAIEEAVDAGRLAPGTALPAERELAMELGVSRVTVRRAIDALAQDGLLQRRHGSGTFVAQPVDKIQQPLKRLTSFTEDMESRGLSPRSRWIERSLVAASPEEIMKLGLSPGSQVARLKRIRLADDMPVAIETTSLPADVLPDPESVTGSLYERLAQSGVKPVRAVQRITAALVTEAQSTLMGVPVGAPALVMDSTAFNETGRAVEVTRAYYRSDVYDFISELTL
ncbi:GntR family transcriptional regulator [Martelella mediterranea]|uniref:GntR family transcriptional regulator n=1 Tax=Martelella mediterranea TaxID=293089 RepID=A0A4R3NUB5_9HYPH|nr:GntR family transcriptional regulator [Martelella mediterranea]TCT39909.1 GntR family transcriptional regulator [Martelella mediterranea]